jgi:hypothetical protein
VPIVSVTNVEQVDETTEKNYTENSEEMAAENEVKILSKTDETDAEHEENPAEHSPANADPEMR